MRRAARVLLAVCLALSGATALAAPATGEGSPVVVDAHDKAAPSQAVHLSADGDALVYTDATARSYLARAPFTGEPTVLRDDALTGWYHDEVRGGIVAMPRVPAAGTDTVTTVDWCAVDACLATTEFTVPAGTVWVGHGGSAAALYDAADHALVLAPWAGGDAARFPLGAAKRPRTVEVDASGIVLAGPYEAAYVDRATGAVTVLGPAGHATLTPSYVVWFAAEWRTAAGTYVTTIRRVSRSDPASAVVVAELPQWLASRTFGATDVGIGYHANGAFRTRTWTGGEVVFGSGAAQEVAAAPDGSLLVHHPAGSPPGTYALPPGSATATFVHSLPPLPALPRAMAVSGGRVGYATDETPAHPFYVRSVSGGTLGAETTVAASARAVALSGPYVVFTRDGSDHDRQRVSFGEPGALRSVELPTGGSARVAASGRRALVTGRRSWLVDIPTGRVRDLGAVNAAIFGDHLVTVTGYGRIERRNLATGAVQVVRAPTCATPCTEVRGLAVWGDEVVYGLRIGGTPVAGRWTGATGVTTPLPMLATTAWHSISYWDGLLLVAGTDYQGVLHDLRGGAAPVPVPGRVLGPDALDGYHVAFQAGTYRRGRAAVQPVTDFFPGYRRTPRYVGTSAPAGFGPGLPVAAWRPAVTLTSDVTWRVELRRGTATGPVVRTLTGTSAGAVARPVWDGRSAAGGYVPTGWYSWALTGTDAHGTALTDATGATRTVRGRVYFSQAAPAAPRVYAPVLAGATGGDGRFTVRWSGAPAGGTYRVARADDYWGTQPWTTVTRGTTATSVSVAGRAGHTYRHRVVAVDPAGRPSAGRTVTTVVPGTEAETAARYAPGVGPWYRATGAAFWRGAHYYTKSAGSHYGVSLYGGTLWLIGSKGPSHGRLEVTIDGDRRYVVDTYAPEKRHRQVLFSIGGLDPRIYHRLTVHVLGTPGRPWVSIDAVAGRWMR